MMKTILTNEPLNFELPEAGFPACWHHMETGTLVVDKGHTLYGILASGSLDAEFDWGTQVIPPEMAFSIPGPAKVEVRGLLLGIRCFFHRGLFQIVGPVEKEGRLNYIDGCTDTLLIPPLVRGNPCLSHLHFPSGIDQTLHTHPSYRLGLVLRGSGLCELEDGMHKLSTGMVFYLPSDTLHGFKTENDTMDIIAFHPDSDHGPESDDHPMINRTMVEGVSARYLEEIRT